MSKGGFSVTISAVDGASSTIAAVNKQLLAMRKPVDELRASTDRLFKSVGQLGQTTGVNLALGTLGRSFRAVGHGAATAVSAITKFAPALGALTAAGTVAGLAALVQNFGSMGQSLLNAANRAGLATDQLQGLENGARIAGVAAGTMTAGITTLRDNLVDAVGGRAPEFIRMMQSLGLAWQDGAGHARDVSAALPEIADRIAMIKDPTLQARAATALFGGAAEAMLPYLRRGSAGMADYTRKARQYGVINEEAAHQAQILRESQAELGLAVEGLGNSIAATLGPVLSPMLHDLSLWIAANRSWIASDITDMVKSLADAIKSVDWKSVSKSIVNTAEAVTGLVKALMSGDPGAGLIAVFEKITGWHLPDWLKAFLEYKVDAPRMPGSYAPTPGFVPPNLMPHGPGLDWNPAPSRTPSPPTGGSWWQRNMPAFLGGAAAPQAGTAVSPDVPPEGRALLNAIAGGESDGSYRDQPSSTGAKGRYQFLDSTWREVSGKTGRFAWSPENQDINAWFYAQQRYRLATGGRDLDGDLKAGINPAYGLNKIWTSLPGGPEHNNATDSFGERLQDGLRHPPAVPAAAPVYGPPAPSPAPPAPIAGPSGKASLTVRLAGFPEGTGTAATQSGEIWDNTPIIERAMPMTAGR